MMHRIAVLWFLLPVIVRGGDEARFLTAEKCSLCHTRIPPPESGGWIGPYALWEGSMMANASRDPYWQAKVRQEVQRSPTRGKEIEDTCLRCHAPAQQYAARVLGKRLGMAEVGELGRDGVTCTVCHQMVAEGLGQETSFTGGFVIGTSNLIFGPHANPFGMPMLHHTGFEPREGQPILEAALCGTCHTVITDGFVEQAPYLEWLASGYARSGKTCQGCHAPELAGAAGQYIAHRPPGGPFPPTRRRRPFGLHWFAGGNTVIPQLLKRSADGARRQLSRALRLEVSTRREGRTLWLTVVVVNQAGHKLPTGFPSRRLWLHVAAHDKAGRTIFESGGWDAITGELRSGEAFQPHRSLIGRGSEVQVFEAEMVDGAGRPTVSLLAAAAYSKDNRILPAGFEGRGGGRPIGPVGVGPDAGFGPGSARTVYRMALPSGVESGRVIVEALFQTIKPGYRLSAVNLGGELAAPVVIARQETEF